jgi:hypothetical protein
MREQSRFAVSDIVKSVEKVGLEVFPTRILLLCVLALLQEFYPLSEVRRTAEILLR